jgi:hypothetical protein
MLLAIMVPGMLVTFLGINYWFIPMGTNERAGFLGTIVLTEVMFLVMLTSFLPLSKEIPMLGYLFLVYTIQLILLTVLVMQLESTVVKWRSKLALYEE